MSKRKGIILAGGTGSRLYPLTLGISKHLMPIYDKPMIYYPLSVLMLADIRDILIITTPRDEDQFRNVLGDGSAWGLSLNFKVQPTPDGLAQAYVLAESFLNNSPSAMILGDNIFHGHGLQKILFNASQQPNISTIFCYQVADPRAYGVVQLSQDGEIINILEKPQNPCSKLAITGLYLLDSQAPSMAKELKKSCRGEYEITDLLNAYVNTSSLDVCQMGRGFAWLDTGNYNNLLDAGNFVRTLVKRQGVQIGSPDEIAINKGWVTKEDLEKRAQAYRGSPYGQFLLHLIDN